jgi:hypothetical protein
MNVLTIIALVCIVALAWLWPKTSGLKRTACGPLGTPNVIARLVEPFSAHYSTGKSLGLTKQSDAVVGKTTQLFSRASAAGAHSTGNQKNVTKNKLTNYDTQR